MIRKYQQGGAASSEDEQVVQILQAAIQNGLIDEQAAQLLYEGYKSQDPETMQVLQQIVEALQQPQLTVAARLGAKLTKVMLLNNKCPDGYEITRNAKGSKICMKCKGGKSKVKKGLQGMDAKELFETEYSRRRP